MVQVHQRHLDWLERVAGLNRDLEGLPTDEELNERREADTGLTAPELSIVLPYTKIALADELLASDLPEDPEFGDELIKYFPTAIRDRFVDRIAAHPLARELIATIVTNRLVDRAGLSMAHRLAEETSARVADIARAHYAAWRIFDLETTWAAIDALDNEVPADVQTLMLLETKRLGERATRWLLRNQPLPLDATEVIGRYEADVELLRDVMADVLREPDERAVKRTMKLVTDEGVPDELAGVVARMALMITALDIIEIQRKTGAPMAETAATYLALDDELGLGWFRERIIALPRNDRWDSLARSALRDDFFRAHADLTANVLGARRATDTGDADSLVDSWIAARRLNVDHCLAVLADIRATGRADLAQLSVGLRELRNLIHIAGREAT